MTVKHSIFIVVKSLALYVRMISVITTISSLDFLVSNRRGRWFRFLGVDRIWNCVGILVGVLIRLRRGGFASVYQDL